jgi:hypothetical protein
MSILLIVALTVFGRTMIRKIQLLSALEHTDRINHLKERLKNMVILAIGQKRLVGRARERSSGIMHALIFWGFCVLLIRSLNLYGQGFQEGFHLPFLGDDYLLGYLYIALKDIMEGIVLLMIIWAIFRRSVLKPKRLHDTFEAYLVLGFRISLDADIGGSGSLDFRIERGSQHHHPGHYVLASHHCAAYIFKSSPFGETFSCDHRTSQCFFEKPGLSS